MFHLECTMQDEEDSVASSSYSRLPFPLSSKSQTRHTPPLRHNLSLSSTETGYNPTRASAGSISRLASPSFINSPLLDSEGRAATKIRRWRVLFLACAWFGALVWLGTMVFGLYLMVVLREPEWPRSAEFSDDFSVGIRWLDQGGGINGSFIPSRHTVVLVHDREPGSVEARHMPSLNGKHNEPLHGVDMNLAGAWLDDAEPWNVGIFYWHQYADEVDIVDAEAKVWSNEGNAGMRWRSSDGRWHQPPTTSPLADVLVQEILNLNVTGGRELRLVGHGIGAQIVIAATHTLYSTQTSRRINPSLLPQRIALLDPFYTDHRPNYLDGSTRSLISTRLHALKNMNASVAIEVYRCSLAQRLYGGIFAQLNDESVFVQSHLDWIPKFQLKAKQRECLNQYFWLYNNVEPPLEIDFHGQERGHVAPCARLPTAELYSRLSVRLPGTDESPVWDQVRGKGYRDCSTGMAYRIVADSVLGSVSLSPTRIKIVTVIVCVFEGLIAIVVAFVLRRMVQKRIIAKAVRTEIVFSD